MASLYDHVVDGTDGAVVLEADSGWTYVTGTDAHYETTDAAEGTSCVQIAVVGGNTIHAQDHAASAIAWHVRYFKFTAWPAATTSIMSWKTGGSAGTVVGALRVLAAGTLSLRDGTAGATITTAALTLNQWYRVAVGCTPGVNGHRLKTYTAMNLYGNVATDDLTGAATAAGATTTDYVSTGAISASTITYFYDRARGDDATEPAGAAVSTIVTPGSVTGTGGVGVQKNAEKAPAKVAGVAGVGVPTVTVPNVTTVAPATVAGTGSVMPVVTPIITSTVTPATVSGRADVGAPTEIGTADRTVVLPAPVAGAAGVGTPTVALGGSATIHPGTVAGTAGVGAPTETTGDATTVHPDTVEAVAEIADTTESSSSVVIAVGTVAAVAAVPEPTVAITDELYLFRTPVRVERYLIERPGFYASRQVGITITRTGTTYRQVVGPSQYELEAADQFWLGGYRHLISGAEADLLSDAGYAEFIERTEVPQPDPPPVLVLASGYGEGAYGEGVYGS